MRKFEARLGTLQTELDDTKQTLTDRIQDHKQAEERIKEKDRLLDAARTQARGGDTKVDTRGTTGNADWELEKSELASELQSEKERVAKLQERITQKEEAAARARAKMSEAQKEAEDSDVKFNEMSLTLGQQLEDAKRQLDKANRHAGRRDVEVNSLREELQLLRRQQADAPDADLRTIDLERDLQREAERAAHAETLLATTRATLEDAKRRLLSSTAGDDESKRNHNTERMLVSWSGKPPGAEPAESIDPRQFNLLWLAAAKACYDLRTDVDLNLEPPDGLEQQRNHTTPDDTARRLFKWLEALKGRASYMDADATPPTAGSALFRVALSTTVQHWAQEPQKELMDTTNAVRTALSKLPLRKIVLLRYNVQRQINLEWKYVRVGAAYPSQNASLEDSAILSAMRPDDDSEPGTITDDFQPRNFLQDYHMHLRLMSESNAQGVVTPDGPITVVVVRDQQHLQRVIEYCSRKGHATTTAANGTTEVAALRWILIDLPFSSIANVSAAKTFSRQQPTGIILKERPADNVMVCQVGDPWSIMALVYLTRLALSVHVDELWNILGDAISNRSVTGVLDRMYEQMFREVQRTTRSSAATHHLLAHFALSANPMEYFSDPGGKDKDERDASLHSTARALMGRYLVASVSK